jgi:hypothetical protein
VQFIVNDGNGENEERATGLSGALARRCKDVEIKSETVPNFCLTLGIHATSRVSSNHPAIMARFAWLSTATRPLTAERKISVSC